MPPSDIETTRPAEDKDIIIRASDVTVRFGSKTILDGLNLDVRRGEILGFVGRDLNDAPHS